MSPSKSFQGHTGPIHDVCQTSIGKFHLILTASSDFSVRVCSQISLENKSDLETFSCGILSRENVYVHFYFPMKFILSVHHRFQQRSTVEPTQA